VSCDKTSDNDKKQVKATRLERFLVRVVVWFKEGLLERWGRMFAPGNAPGRVLEASGFSDCSACRASRSVGRS